MKKNKIEILFICLLLFGCTKKEIKVEISEIVDTEDKTIEINNIENQFQLYEMFNLLQDNSIQKIEDIMTFFKEDDYYCYAKIGNITTQKDIPLFSLNLNNNLVQQVGIIPMETEVRILGHLQQNQRLFDTDYLLIKTDDSLFNGWCSENDILFHIQERELYLFPPVINISPDNEYFSCISNVFETESIIISNRTGDKIFYIPTKKIEITDEYKKYGVDYEFIGWGVEKKLLWFSFGVDSPIPLGYVIIDYQNENYKIVNNINNYIYYINFDSGDCLFTKNEKDFVIEPNEDSSEKYSTTIFHTNIYNQTKIDVVNSVKIGNSSTLFTYGPNNELLYLNENDEYIEYKPNQSN